MTRIAFSTLGCKVNQYDTAVIQSAIKNGSEGYAIVPFDDEADIYVVNTCTVTGKGDVESRRLIRGAIRRNSRARVIVTGCYAQTRPGEVAGIEGVSMVLGNEEKYAIMDYLKQDGNHTEQHQVFVGDISNASVFSHPGPTDFPARTRAFLNVQDGCDSRCSYCIVPFARGGSRSLNSDDVIGQVRALDRSGCKEIVLCGVHLGGYGRDLSPLYPKTTLASLMERILSETEIPRIRLSSIEPREITDELIGLMASEDRICRHLHIPFQSGDDDILRRMNRNYTVEFFGDLVSKIHKEIEDAGIGCDVMVGYPGEEERHFEKTCQLIERLPITYLHVFAYSPRSGTAAAGLKETVKGDVKRGRSEVIRGLGEGKNTVFKERYIGRVVDILVEENRDDLTDLFKGYTGNYLKVLLGSDPEDPSFVNEVVGVRLSGMVNDALSGEVLRGGK